MAIRPDPNRTHVRAKKIPRPHTILAGKEFDPEADPIGGMSAGCCWANAADGETVFGHTCPGCAYPTERVVRRDPKDAGPDDVVTSGDVEQPEKLTINTKLTCARCGWWGYLQGGVFIKP